MENHKKNLHITTYGCQMNVYDSQKMAELLSPHGFAICNNQDDADLVILNTCHIREKASEKVFSELGRVKQKKIARQQENKDTIIVVAGCTAQAEGEEIFKKAPYVSIVVGPQSYHNLPQLIQEIKNKNKKWAINLDFPVEPKFDSITHDLLTVESSAFLAVQEGCDQFCHFCVVPYTRGAEYSRNVSDIYREAQKLVSQGVLEITLLGQNVSGYHGIATPGEKEWGLGKLIDHISKINGLKRIRYMTSHPLDMKEDELFEAHASNEKLMPFLHLPVQSGSSKILDSMNRKYNKEQYLDIIARFRKARPDMAFSSDFIVGYPGETDDDFNETLDVVRKVGYAQCYSFKYSPRPGTPAAILYNQVPEDIKTKRLAILQKLIVEQQIAFNETSVGKVFEVLFDRKGKRKGQLLGKSPYMQSVVVTLNDEDIEKYSRQIVNVKIDSANQNSLFGHIEE